MEKFIAKNAQIREPPLFDRPDQETLDRIAATETRAAIPLPWERNWSTIYNAGPVKKELEKLRRTQAVI